MKLFILGVILTVVFWVIAWTRITPFFEYAFFPLWLGYILSVNGLCQWLFGKSLIGKTGLAFLWLFVISVPLWWFFEFLNLFTHNWRYIFPSPVTPLEYFVRASIAFSTVVPAVLSTSFFTHRVIAKIKPLTSRGFNMGPPILLSSFLLGIVSLGLIPSIPNLVYPLLWIGLFLIFDPVNYLLKFPSFIEEISQGRLTKISAVAIATLMTGFWWELWNSYSMPKWTYSVPYVGAFKIFEMPILGFLGYPFFGLEVYTFTNFVLGIAKKILKWRHLKLEF